MPIAFAFFVEDDVFTVTDQSTLNWLCLHVRSVLKKKMTNHQKMRLLQN